MRTIKRSLAFALVVGMAVFLVRWGWGGIQNMLYPVRYYNLIQQAAAEYDLEPALICGIIKTESNFVYDAHSGVARGLMQITEDTAAWIAKKMPMEKFSQEMLDEPRINILMGCFYLRYLIDYYKDLPVALAAYNAGMGNVNRWLSNKQYSPDGKTLSEIPFAETNEYVKRVEKYTHVYRKELAKQ